MLGFFLAGARRQKSISTELYSDGATVWYRYHFQNPSHPTEFCWEPTQNSWLADRLGSDYCSSIFQIDSQQAQNPARIVELASEIPGLRVLRVLVTGKLDDKSLRPVVECKNLWHLQLNGTNISDASFSTLSQMRWLKSLDISDTLISEDIENALRQLLPDTDIRCSRTGWYRQLQDLEFWRRFNSPVTSDRTMESTNNEMQAGRRQRVLLTEDHVRRRGDPRRSAMEVACRFLMLNVQ